MGQVAVDLARQIHLEKVKEYYRMNKSVLLKRYKIYRKANPLKSRYAQLKVMAKAGRINLQMNYQDLEKMWNRDGAGFMKKARLHLINPEKPYSLDNCMFRAEGTRNPVRRWRSYREISNRRVAPFLSAIVEIYNFVSWRDYVLNKNKRLHFMSYTNILKKNG